MLIHFHSKLDKEFTLGTLAFEPETRALKLFSLLCKLLYVVKISNGNGMIERTRKQILQ